MKKMFIVGASSSVGPKVIRAFEERGWFVLPTYSSRELNHTNAVQLDLTDPYAIKNFVGLALSKVGPFDAGVFLAGVCRGKRLDNGYSYADMARVMSVNVTGPAYLIGALGDVLADNSQLILTSSISAERGSYDPIYAASKAAIVGLAKSLVAQLAPRTRVNVISPGLIEDSGMYRDMSIERRAHHKVASPTKKLLQPSDVAGVIVDLVQPHWAQLNGAVISLNGGAHV